MRNKGLMEESGEGCGVIPDEKGECLKLALYG